MTTDLQKILRELAKDIVQEAKNVMDTAIGINAKAGKNTLTDSDLQQTLTYALQENGDNLAINLLYNFYVVYIEWERPAEYKAPPPFEVIKKWMVRKHIPPKNGDIMKAAETIRWAIWKKGWSGRPVIQTMLKMIEPKWTSEYSNKLFEATIKDLTDYFN